MVEQFADFQSVTTANVGVKFIFIAAEVTILMQIFRMQP